MTISCTVIMISISAVGSSTEPSTLLFEYFHGFLLGCQVSIDMDQSKSLMKRQSQLLWLGVVIRGCSIRTMSIISNNTITIITITVMTDATAAPHFGLESCGEINMKLCVIVIVILMMTFVTIVVIFLLLTPQRSILCVSSFAKQQFLPVIVTAAGAAGE